MGAWDYGIFDSDSNCDAWAEFYHSDDPVKKTISVLDEYVAGTPPSYIEVDEAGYIILSALLVIGFQNIDVIQEQPADIIPDYFKKQVVEVIHKHQSKYDESKNTKIGEHLIPQASKICLNLVCSDAKKSELYDLWEESGAVEKWLAGMSFMVDLLWPF